MLRIFLSFFLLLVLWSEKIEAEVNEWRQWRGPTANAVAGKDASPPLVWSQEKNVKWRAAIPGRGLSSPVLVKGRIILTTATEDDQLLCAYQQSDGALLWNLRVHEGGLTDRTHRKNSYATPTVASDGEKLYVVFLNRGRVMISAVSLDGKLLWQVDAGPYECDYGYGYAPSPALVEDRLIVSAEFRAEGFIAAFSTRDGSELWRSPRRIKTSYSSPVVARVAGRSQVLMSGGNKLCAYDPSSGRLLWEVEGCTLATCGTMVWSEDSVFASGGFPNKETIAVRLSKDGGEPEVLWRTEVRCYEQSLLYQNGLLYAYDDTGIAHCWDAVSGEEKWKVRLGGPVSASPVFAEGRVYAMNERGITHVFEATADRFVPLAENSLGDEGFATSAFVDGEVFIRTATLSGEQRQEWLYCVAEE